MLKYPSVQASKRNDGRTSITSVRVFSSTDTTDPVHSKQRQRRGSKSKTTPASLKTGAKTAKSTPEKHYTLQWKEWMYIVFIWETPLFQIVNFVDIITERGGVTLILAYLLYSVFVTMPIFTFLLFCGAYTKKGYIKLWQMVPILKGMAWSVTIFSIFLEMFNISIAGLALLYIPDLFHGDVPWSDCNFKGATRTCFPRSSKISYNRNCTFGEDTIETLHFPAYDYFMYNKLNSPLTPAEYKTVGELETPWVCSVSITWFIIYILLIVGFDKFRTLIRNMTYGFAFLFFISTIYLTVFISKKVPRPSFMDYNFNRVFKVEFWAAILTHSLTRTLPGNLVVLGSHSPASMRPNINVFCSYGMKFVCLTFIMVWVSTTVQILQQSYHVSDLNCVPIFGLSLLFAIIPELLSHLPVPQLPLFLYFFGLWFFGMLSALYTVHAFYDSVIEARPGIIAMKVYFCAVLCIICGLLNMGLLTNLYLSIIDVWSEFGLTHITITLSLVLSVAICIYSVNKYGNDFYFQYGKRLHSFWMHGLKINFVVSALCYALAVTGNIPIMLRYPSNSYVFFWCYLMMGIILAPIFFAAIAVYMQYKNKGKAVKAIMPTAEWGPPLYADKQIRHRFNPKRETREILKCRHTCLLNSKKVKEEIEVLQKNQVRLALTIEGETDNEEYQL